MQRYLILVKKLENSLVLEGESITEICTKYFETKKGRIKQQQVNISQISEIEWRCECLKETFFVKKILIENEDRNRKYGVRVGDVVMDSGQFKRKAVVEDLILADNNRVFVRIYDGTTIAVIAEWLEIVKRVKE